MSKTAEDPFKVLLTEETAAASSCDISVLFFFLELSVGFIAGGQHYQTPASPPSHHPRRALGVCEASAPSFCSYLVWSGPVAPGWKAEGGQPASCEESPGFLLVWEAWRRITKRRYEILKSSKEERGGPTNTHRHTIIKNKKERKIKSVTETHTYLKPGVFSLVSWNQQLEFDTHACVRLCMCVRMCVCVCVCVCSQAPAYWILGGGHNPESEQTGGV